MPLQRRVGYERSDPQAPRAVHDARPLAEPRQIQHLPPVEHAEIPRHHQVGAASQRQRRRRARELAQRLFRRRRAQHGHARRVASHRRARFPPPLRASEASAPPVPLSPLSPARAKRARPSPAPPERLRPRCAGSRCSGRGSPRARCGSTRGQRAALLDPRSRRHQHARRADAALRAAVSRNAAWRTLSGGLGGTESASERLDRAHGPTLHLADGHQAAVHGPPSRSTVQAPHSPSPQPSFVPVRARSSRSTSMSRRNGGPPNARRLPIDDELEDASSDCALE